MVAPMFDVSADTAETARAAAKWAKSFPK